MSNKAQFLRAVLGEDGAAALQKAVARSQDLETVLLPRTVLAWVNVAARSDYEGQIPGIDNTYVSIKKTDGGFNGEVTVGDELYSFKKANLYHVAASISVSMGMDDTKLPPGTSPAELVRLGKSIDLLVKARAVTHEILQKKVLDPSKGYQFHVEHASVPGFDKSVTRVVAKDKNGQHAGSATLAHADDKHLEPVVVAVQPAHQRKGVASQMYKLAEQETGKVIRPSEAQLGPGKKLWQGNKKIPQFGPQAAMKTELPGQTALPTPAHGPLQPIAPTRRQSKLPKQKSKIPTAQAPATQSTIPSVAPSTAKPPAAPPKLKLSEAQLRTQCTACGGKQLDGNRFVGCMCFRALAKNVSVEFSENRVATLTFGKDWDEDSVSLLLESVGNCK